MSLPERMRKRNAQDRELEHRLRIRNNDSQRYAPADIEALENERLPWLRELRRRLRDDAR